jgi:hypothetical protein
VWTKFKGDDYCWLHLELFQNSSAISQSQWCPYILAIRYNNTVMSLYVNYSILCYKGRFWLPSFQTSEMAIRRVTQLQKCTNQSK